MRLKLCFLALALGAMGAFVYRRSTWQPHVLLIITDTTRVDRFGCYGNRRGLTPYMDDLARQGLLFEHASSHAPFTLPSIASMLTSLHPEQHGAGGRLRDFSSLDPEVTTLPAVFGRAGYSTHAIANVFFLSAPFGVTRDFKTVDLVAPASNLEMRDAERTTDAALAWMKEAADGDQPFLLLVHYFDPHAVYAPPQPFHPSPTPPASLRPPRSTKGSPCPHDTRTPTAPPSAAPSRGGPEDHGLSASPLPRQDASRRSHRRRSRSSTPGG